MPGCPISGTKQMFLMIRMQWASKCVLSRTIGDKSGCIWYSVQFSRSVTTDSLRPHELQHTRPPCPSPTSGVHPNSCHRVGDAIQTSHPLYLVLEKLILWLSNRPKWFTFFIWEYRLCNHFGKLWHYLCGVGEDSWESLRLQGDPTSPF